MLAATPDVVVLRTGANPWATVIDAKYVGRTFVERDAARVHDKYARIRLDGTPVVRHVLAAHPHIGFSNLWAGYGHVPMTPGIPVPPLPLPLPRTDRNPDQAGTPTAAGEIATASVLVVADQAWMHRHLGDDRIDLVALAKWAADDADILGAHMIVPLIDKLDGFATAAANRGWDIDRIADRGPQAYGDEMLRLINQLPDARLVLITGDDRLAHRVQAQRTDVRIVSDLSGAPHKAGGVEN